MTKTTLPLYPDRTGRRRRRLHKVVLAVTSMAIISTVGVTSSAPAYATCYSGGMGFENINIAPVGVSTYWWGVLDQAAYNWNSSGAGTSIRRVGSSGGTYTAGRYPDLSAKGWYGEYAFVGQRAYDRTFKIRINAALIERDANPNDYGKWNIAVTVHEIGHALSLADNPPVSEYSIMKYPVTGGGRPGWGAYSLPTQYDVNEVRRCS